MNSGCNKYGFFIEVLRIGNGHHLNEVIPKGFRDDLPFQLIPMLRLNVIEKLLQASVCVRIAVSKIHLISTSREFIAES